MSDYIFDFGAPDLTKAISDIEALERRLNGLDAQLNKMDGSSVAVNTDEIKQSQDAMQSQLALLKQYREQAEQAALTTQETGKAIVSTASDVDNFNTSLESVTASSDIHTGLTQIAEELDQVASGLRNVAEEADTTSEKLEVLPFDDLDGVGTEMSRGASPRNGSGGANRGGKRGDRIGVTRDSSFGSGNGQGSGRYDIDGVIGETLTAEFYETLNGLQTKVYQSTQELNDKEEELNAKLQEQVSIYTNIEFALSKATDTKQIEKLKTGLATVNDQLVDTRKQLVSVAESQEALPGIQLFSPDSLDIDKIRSYINEYAGGVEEIQARQDKLAEAIARQKEEYKQLNIQLRQTNDPRIANQLAGAMQQVESQIEDNTKKFKEFTSLATGTYEFELKGDIQLAGLERLSTAISDLTRNSDVLSAILEPVANLLESSEKYGSSILKLQENLNNTATTILTTIPNLTKAQPKLAGAMKGVGTALQSLSGIAGQAAIVLGAVGIAIAAVVAALNILDSVSGKSAEAINSRIERLREEIQLEEDWVTRSDASVEAVNERIAAIQQEIEYRQREADQLRANSIANTGYIDQLRTVANWALNLGNNHAVFGATGDALNEVVGEIETLNAELLQLSGEGFQSVIEAAQEARDAQKRLEDAEDDISQLLDRALETQVSHEEALLTLQETYDEEALETHLTRLEEDESTTRDHLHNLEKLEIAYNQSVEEMRLGHLQELEKAEADFNQEVENDYKRVQEEFAKREKDLAESVIEDQIQLQEELSQNEIDYQEDVIDKEKQFQEERLKRLEDMNKSLYEAELDNDVLGFIQAQKQAEEDQKEADKEREKEREADKVAHEEELAQKKLDLEEKILEDRKNLEKEKQKRLVELAEEEAQKQIEHDKDIARMKAEFAEKLVLEAQNHRRELAQQVAQYEEETEQTRLNRIRQDQDRLERLQKDRKSAEERYQEQMVEYQRQQDGLLAIIESGGSLIVEEEAWTSKQRVDALLDSHEAFLSEQRLMVTDSGLATQDEIARMAALERTARQIEGDETLAELTADADARNALIKERYAADETLRQNMEAQYIADMEAQFYDRDAQYQLHYDTALNALGTHITSTETEDSEHYTTSEDNLAAHHDALSITNTEAFDAELLAVIESNDERLAADRNYYDSALAALATFYQTAQQLTVDWNVTRLDSETSIQQDLLMRREGFYSDHLVVEEEYFRDSEQAFIAHGQILDAINSIYNTEETLRLAGLNSQRLALLTTGIEEQLLALNEYYVSVLEMGDTYYNQLLSNQFLAYQGILNDTNRILSTLQRNVQSNFSNIASAIIQSMQQIYSSISQMASNARLQSANNASVSRLGSASSVSRGSSVSRFASTQRRSTTTSVARSGSLSVSYGNISIGSGMTRNEVLSRFGELEDSIIETFSQSSSYT